MTTKTKQNDNSTAVKYDAGNIQVLKGLEAVGKHQLTNITII